MTVHTSPLTTCQLLRVRRAIDNAEPGPNADVAAVAEIFAICHPDWDTATRIRPSDVSIPTRQLTRIMDWAARTHHDPEIRMHTLLDVWTNVGPSSHDE